MYLEAIFSLTFILILVEFLVTVVEFLLMVFFDLGVPLSVILAWN